MVHVNKDNTYECYVEYEIINKDQEIILGPLLHSHLALIASQYVGVWGMPRCYNDLLASGEESLSNYLFIFFFTNCQSVLQHSLSLNI